MLVSVENTILTNLLRKLSDINIFRGPRNMILDQR